VFEVKKRFGLCVLFGEACSKGSKRSRNIDWSDPINRSIRFLGETLLSVVLFWIAHMKKRKTAWIVLVMVCLTFFGGRDWLASTNAAGSFVFKQEGGSRRPALPAARAGEDSPYIALYVPTPQEVVDRMLELGDVVYDLGSGDGRIVITAAARYGVKAVGFEISPGLVKRSRDNIKEAGLEHLVEIREEDIRTVDLSPASLVTLYLYPSANLRLRSMIQRQLKPGSRVVSHQFTMGTWKPERVD
jgi:hypothetical protein